MVVKHDEDKDFFLDSFELDCSYEENGKERKLKYYFNGSKEHFISEEEDRHPRVIYFKREPKLLTLKYKGYKPFDIYVMEFMVKHIKNYIRQSYWHMPCRVIEH